MLSQMVEEKQLQEVVMVSGNADQQTEKASKGLFEIEDSKFPIEFLFALEDTAFETIRNYLTKSDAPQVVLDLLEDVECLIADVSQLEQGKVERHVNENLVDLIPSLTNNIVGAGGIFYVPDGMTIAREIPI